MTQKTSIILLTYNRSDALRVVLNGLFCQNIKPYEVIISDDGSRPEHIETIKTHIEKRDWPFKVKYIWSPDIGFTASRARNQAVEHSSGDYIIFLDGDCIPRPDFTSQHIGIRRPHCFINGSRVLLSKILTQKIISHPTMAEYPISFWLSQRVTGHINKLLPIIVRIPNALRRTSSSFRWKGIRSCNFSLWREDFDKVNGFDETFVGWGHEDADFVWRLHQAGCRRINGFWATEVLHLWHKEANRDRESANARRLQERMTDPNAGHVATKGIREAAYDDCEIVYSN
jgi:glycosyltransferase involved in cell wall biosynthesis